MKKNLYNYNESSIENIDNNSFIYVYLDPRRPGEYKYGDYKFDHEPFYVGVSSGRTIHDRKVRHLQYAKNDKDITNNNYKKNIIKAILFDKLEPIILKYMDGLSLSEAFLKEKDMIKIIGNRYDESGPLVNISKGGDGGDNFTSDNYTDLRQAYTETLIPVTQEDYNKMQKFNNISEYKRHRDQVDVTPLTKEEAERKLLRQQNELNQQSAALAFKYAQEAEKAKQKQQSFWGDIKQLTGW